MKFNRNKCFKNTYENSPVRLWDAKSYRNAVSAFSLNAGGEAL